MNTKQVNSYKILTEDKLEKLVCSICNNYLSYGKAKIGGKHVICGRCNQEEAVLPFFNENIYNCLFPCINRFDDCRELLPYRDVPEHEKSCPKISKHACSECEYNGNGCQLYHHFIKNHPDHVLKHPTFIICLSLKTKWNYLYRYNHNLFLFTYDFTKSKVFLLLSVQSLGRCNNEELKCEIIVKSLWGKEYLRTEFQSELNTKINMYKQTQAAKEYFVSCHLSVTNSSELFILKAPKTGIDSQSRPVRTASQSQKRPQNEAHSKHLTDVVVTSLLPKLVCSGCRCYVVPPIFKCAANHVRCEDCDSFFCSACDDVVNWSRGEDLELLAEFLPLPCRWSCDANLIGSELRSHEKNCAFRRYNCTVEYCPWRGSFSDLRGSHWHDPVKIYDDTHRVNGFEEDLVEFYLFYDKEIFYCRIDPFGDDGRRFHVRKVSNVSPRTQKYGAKIFLRHVCDNVRLHKEAPLRFGGITHLKRNCFDCFGHCKNYKIIFTLFLIPFRT